jgi:hypothetical protein
MEPQRVTTPTNATQPVQTTPPVQFRPVNFTSSWREEALARICELRALIGSFKVRAETDAQAAELLDSADAELTHARQAAARRTIGGALTGAAVHRVHAHLDTAEVLILRAAPPEYVRGQTADLVVYVRRHLVPSDPRWTWAEQILEAEGVGERIAVRATAPTAPTSRPGTGLIRRATRRGSGASAATGADEQGFQADRERLVTAVRGAMAEARNEQMRLRSFRNLLLSSALGLLALAIGICVVGAVAPEKLPVCFQPVQAAPAETIPTQPQTRRLVCPTREADLPSRSDLDTVVATTVGSWDVPLIELLGLIAAAVAAATALRKVRGTNTPYSLPAALAFLKLPLGALTALLGLILMRGNFVPGLSALDTSAQIIAWAVIFGYAQQAFTQVVDRKAQNLLEDVGGAEQREKPATPAVPTATTEPAREARP